MRVWTTDTLSGNQSSSKHVIKLIIDIPFEPEILFFLMNLLGRKSQVKIKLFKGEWLNNSGVSIGNNIQLLKKNLIKQFVFEEFPGDIFKWEKVKYKKSVK